LGSSNHQHHQVFFGCTGSDRHPLKAREHPGGGRLVRSDKIAPSFPAAEIDNEDVSKYELMPAPEQLLVSYAR